MTFFYDLNKRLADLAKKQTLAEDKGSKPDFLDMDKDGDKKEPMKKAVADKGSAKSGKMFGKKTDMDESAFQAAIGKKKYGADGMKALQKAGRDQASNKTMNTIRNRYDKYDEGMTDEGNEFSGELAQARASGAKEFNVDGKSYPVREDDVDDFIKAGGKVQYGKAQKGPRRPGLSFGSKHIGVAGGAGKASQISGRGANTGKSGKPVVAVETDSPMTPKQKSFAKLAPPANKITFADKIAGAKKEVDEMLGDVGAEAIKGAIGKKKEPRSKGTAFDPDVAKSMSATDKHPRYDVKDTGYSKRYTRKVQDEPADDVEVSTEPKKKGRPKGPEKGPERVTKGSYKFKSGRPAKTEEDRDPGADRGEYGREGDMAKEQMRTIMSAAKELRSILDDEQDLPEWVQKKITLAMDYIDTARDYMSAQDGDTAEPVAEKAVSKKQQRFMGMVHAAKKGEKPASKEVAKVAKGMGKKDAEDFAATKHKGLPEKVKTKKKDESVEETADAPKEKKSSGGYNFGGGVYESLDRKFQQALTEGMNVSVNMSTGQDGQPTKSINISADGEDADRLADLLKMAGIQGHGEESCQSCGQTPCGCESLDENSPDWPTNTETSDNAMQYSGGLNGPKSTGQSTTPVLASQLRRQVSMEEGVKLEQSLFKLYNQYKLK
jgi:hypothetical protein